MSDFFAFTLLIFIFVVSVSYTVYLMMIVSGAFFGAPFIPSNKKTIKKMLEISGAKPGEVAYDLGSGDGRFVFALADYGLHAKGVEISYPVHWYARIKQMFFAKGGRLIRGDIYKTDLRDADIVFTYLFPNMMKRLAPKLAAELKEGSRVISNGFPIENWTPYQKIDRLGNRGTIYLYKM